MLTDDPFTAIARFYDLDLEGYDDDVRLYLDLASEYAGGSGGAVLELGCGTGRVALALAHSGFEVVGVDSSAAMLDVARARTGPADRVEWVRADMRTLDLGRTFPLVLVPLGGLQHLEVTADVVRALDAIRRHLEPGGAAVVDVEAPRPEDFEAGPHPLIEHWTRRAGDRLVTKLVSVEGAPASGLREVTWHFDEQAAGEPLRRWTAQFVLRTFTLAELELAARLAGLEVTAAHGDYDGAPYDDGAERLVMTLERAREGGASGAVPGGAS